MRSACAENAQLVRLHQKPISDKPGVMPYAVKLYAYIFVANVLAVVIVARWVKPFGFMVSMAFGLVFTYLTIVTGRWLFGRKEL